MKTSTIEQFYIIGITVRTTNENGQAAIDIPRLWNKFISEDIMSLIPNKIDDSIYCIYTDYEKDHVAPYTTLLGCKVENLDYIPKDLTGKTIAGGEFTVFNAKGNLNHGIVYQEWVKIWNSDIARAYKADFEVYGDKAKNPEEAEIDIFVAVK